MKILSLLATCLVSVLSGCNPSTNVLNNAHIKERLPHKASVVWNPVVDFGLRETVDYDYYNSAINTYPAPGVNYFFLSVRSYDFTRVKGYEVGVDSYTRVDNLITANSSIDLMNVGYRIRSYLSNLTDKDGVDIVQFIVGNISINSAGNNTYTLSSGLQFYHFFNTYTCEGLYFNPIRYYQDLDIFGFDDSASQSYQRYVSLDFGNYPGSYQDFYPNGYWQVPNYFVNTANSGYDTGYTFYSYFPGLISIISLYKEFTANYDYKSALQNVLGLQGMFTLMSNENNEVPSSYVDSYNSGYNNGNNDGYKTGYDVGYGVGYDAGLQVNNPYTFGALFGAIADTPVLIFRSLFNFDLFGTSALVVVMSLFTALVLIFIAKKLLR